MFLRVFPASVAYEGVGFGDGAGQRLSKAQMKKAARSSQIINSELSLIII